MGLDLSLTGTGLVVIRWPKLKVLRYRLLQTEPRNDDKIVPGLHANGKFYGSDEERIEWQRLRIMAAWKKYEPQIVGIEDYAFSKNLKGMRPRAELTGVVKNHLFRKSALVEVCGTGQVKVEATGDGRADKDAVVAACLEVWPELPDIKERDNLADAFWVAVWTAKRLTNFAMR